MSNFRIFLDSMRFTAGLCNPYTKRPTSMVEGVGALSLVQNQFVTILARFGLPVTEIRQAFGVIETW
jgi:hypothetical protein